MPAFHHPPLTEDEFHASSAPHGEAAPKRYVTSVWAGTGPVQARPALVWPLHTRGSGDSVELSVGKEGYLESWRQERY